MPQWMLKDADARLDYMCDWSDWLGTDGDELRSSTWDVPDGLTGEDAAHTLTAATIWLSGGDVGVRYIVTNHIETAAGRIEDRSIILVVTER